MPKHCFGARYTVWVESQEIIERLRDRLTEEPPGIACAYLFGSVARGTQRPESDVDVAVLYATEPSRTLDGLRLRLEGALEAVLRRPVQLVVLNLAPVDLIHRILRDGKLILEVDRSARVRFEVLKRNEFFDLQPIVRRYRQLETVR